MQIGTPPPRSSTFGYITHPAATQSGQPTTDSVFLTKQRPTTAFPGTGIGLDRWLIQMRHISLAQAIDGAKYLSDVHDRPMAVFEYQPTGSRSKVYAAAPLVELTWHAGGYGGSFASKPLRDLSNVDSLFHIDRKAGVKQLLAVVDRARVVTTTTVPRPAPN